MKIKSIKSKYQDKTISAMTEKFGYRSEMAVPRIKKVVINTGIGRIIKEGDRIEEVFETITAITGQRPVKSQAKIAIAGFKVRAGMEVGIKATLRGKRMWDFLDKLIISALPRTRDFQGIKKSAIDSSGTLNLGIKEHIIFPEILPEKVKTIFGLQVNIVTTAKSAEEGMELFKSLDFPIR